MSRGLAGLAFCRRQKVQVCSDPGLAAVGRGMKGGGCKGSRQQQNQAPGGGLGGEKAKD